MTDPVLALELNYDTTIDSLTLNHQQRIRVVMAEGESLPDVGTIFDDINIRTRGVGGAQGSAALNVALGEYLTAFCGLYNSSMVINACALNYYVGGLGSSGVYIGAADFSDGVSYPNQTGNGAGGSLIPAQQNTFTMYQSHGAVGKLVFMETNSPTNQRNGYDDMTVDEKAFVDYALSSASLIAGVQDSYPIAGRLMLTGQNEKLWYKRYRQ